MLDNKGFDLWADGYDKAVGLSDEEKSYPFAGYKEVLGRIYQLVMVKGRAKVLDIGFGTGTLTAKLYEGGCEIWGQDFSERMIELAKAKMPSARLFQGDFSRGLAGPILSERYDFIIATYSLHHLTDSEKISFINTLTGLLKEGGAILIGDVAFDSRQELEQCRRQVGEGWDEDEIYFVYEEILEAFPAMEFEKFSYCAGLLSLQG
ncbi:class I SAM-dependent methyltransferase [Acutalibacter muris]|uniref:class I SAM-dependent methyltransferase n=1 Tax=Acutalibacter muris TaxID=1796620 RepID=UPI001C3EE7B6|nr:class I SAM-dependent methyltransferase [Acutalibacter muris]